MARVALMSFVGSPSTSTRSPRMPVRDAAAVGQLEMPRRAPRWPRERFGRRQARVDEQLELAVQADAVHGARVGDVGAGEDAARRRRPARATLSMAVFSGRADVAAAREAACAGRPRLRTSSAARGSESSASDVSAASLAAAVLHDRQRRDDEDALVLRELEQRRVGRLVDEDVDEPVGAGLDRLASRLVRDVHDREFSLRVRGGDDGGHRLAARASRTSCPTDLPSS